MLLNQFKSLADNQLQTLLYDWNATEADYPKQYCVHDLFEAQALKTPYAIAVVHGDQQLSYAELNCRANRLARHLKQLGLIPDTKVGICAERGLALLVGLLAILKAGGTYVPLDPNYPRERLQFMIEDSAPLALLCELQTATDLAEMANNIPRVILNTEPPEAWADQCSSNLERHETGLIPEHLAYVMYTSGSTGKPKGVEMPHKNLVNLLVWQQDYSTTMDGARTLQFSPISFDVSAQEIFSTWNTGGTLALINNLTSRDPLLLLQFINQQNIERLFIPFIAFEQLAYSATEQAIFPISLREIIVAGEQLRINDKIKRFFASLPDCRLVNQYGPTETHVVTAFTLPGPSADWSRLPPIGRPIANTQIYILDPQGQPVPIGGVGELFISGTGVARGYLNRPELTAERFLNNPFLDQANGRMYKTGDLARWLPDGNIEFIGRNDHQVKIRGFRIELGEIESALVRHPAVREAVVIAQTVSTDKRLIAYYSSADIIDATALRAHLSISLPEYMLPVSYMHLTRFPVTPNGKLDRQALPVPKADAYALSRYEEPLGETELTLAAIWSDLLKIERIGRRDNFFVLGGHSLLAVQLISRLRQVLAIETTLNNLFERPVLCDFALSLKYTDINSLPPIQPVSRQGRLALSFAQQRLWFLSKLDHTSTAYHIADSIRLTGELNIKVLHQALDCIIARHEILRTTLPNINGEPEQRIGPIDTGFTLIEHDLRNHINPEQALKEQGLQEARMPFDLEHGPLIRGQLLRLTDNQFVLLITQHHIISDGWSRSLFIKELNVLYSTLLSGKTNPLPALSLQYADYAAWQRQWLTDERLTRQAEYWQTALQGAPRLLELPSDHVRPTQHDFAGAEVKVIINAELTAQLKALGLRHGVTLFTTLMAAWALMLARLSGQSEVVIGIPSANRNHREIETLIGFFVNTLAIRINLSVELNVAELLVHVQQQILAAQANQDIPFEQVVELLQPPRSLAYAPLFQVMFAWQNTPEAGFELPGLTIAPLDSLQHLTAKFDLTLSLGERDGGISGGLEYTSDLFEPQTVERYLGYWQILLEHMVMDDSLFVFNLPLLSSAERQTLIYAWNDTTTDYPKQRCIHVLFEDQAAQTPDAIAVIHAQQRLTYADLNQRANRLARTLRQLGVVADTRVGICVERGLPMIVGLLGILKAGGAYLPLDPNYPQERLKFMLEDSTPMILLYETRTEAALAGIASNSPCLNISITSAPWLKQSNSNLDRLETGQTAENLAYVIYTSGSTGEPKGVMVPHRAIGRLVLNNGYLKIAAEDRVALAANPVFDASTFEVWTPLLNGARIVVVDQIELLDAQRFTEVLRKYQINILWLTVGLFNQYATQSIVDFTQLRYLIVGGDKLDPHTIRKVIQHSPPQHLLNGYGPTETTTFACTYRVVEVAKEALSIPIGSPIANTQIYILDSKGQPVPIGVIGEVYIGGDGVAKGYLNRPELSAERFLHNPFSGQAEERMYKTGDLARWLADGNIDFIGRNDHQVKIRGFRIELGEIENVLARHPAIRSAVVIPQAEGADKCLIAYYTSEDILEATALRTFLSTQLPDYMLPAAFMHLPAFPLTPNGKLDRQALPTPKADAYALSSYTQPLNETEQILAAIWSDLLKVEQVGRHDNFFALGGHSLLAFKLLSLIKQAFGLNLPLTCVFDSPTIWEMAEVILNQENHIPWFSLFPIQKFGAKPILFWIDYSSQEHAEIIKRLDKDQPVYGLRYGIGCTHEKRLTLPSLETWSACYLEEIIQKQSNGPYFLIGYCYGGLLAYEIAQQLVERGERVGQLFLLDTYVPGVVYDKRKPLRSILKSLKTISLQEIYPKLLSFMNEKKQGLVNYLNGNSFIANKPDQFFWTLVPPIIKKYRIKKYIGHMTLIMAKEMHKNQSLTYTNVFDTPETPWKALIGQSLKYIEIPGNHHSILIDSQAEKIARIIQNEINR